MVEYHYAPLIGVIARMVDGKAEEVVGWSGHHELMTRFLKLRASEEIMLLRTVNFGHAMFHGRSGRVDIYA